VADAVAPIAEWEESGTSVGAVLGALGRLRRAGDRTATRTSVVTLVAVARDDDERVRACETTALMGGRHPGRTIVVHADSDAQPGLRARVQLLEGSAGGVRVWSEDVTLTVGGAAARHLDSLVEPLTLPDLPLAVWYVGTSPDPDEPLCRSADVVIVDSKELGEADCFPELVHVSRTRTLIDLSWVRLTPWRVLMAALFEGRVYRPFVHRITEAEVRAKPGVRELLGGWLGSRLDLDAVRMEDDKHASMRLTAEGGRFLVERRGEERLVRASARIDDGPGHEELLSLPDTTLAWSLAEALSDLEGDPVYVDALEAALSFAR
jgi:glucose-6-phosphate dehydrogenase assembly protein OpcA